MRNKNNPSKNAMRTALFLRPFWEPDRTATRLTTVARLVRPYGKLLAIRNGNEELSARKRRKLNVDLIDVADDAWQENAIEYIRAANAVIAHIAPPTRSGPTLLKPIVPDPTPRSNDSDLLREQVHQGGSSHGVLLELDYCQRAKAGAKLLVLVPESFTDRLTEILRAIRLQQSGTIWRPLGSEWEAVSPRVSALDDALSILKEARAMITYKRFGDLAFSMKLTKELSGLMSSSLTHSCAPGPKVPTGIPPEPVRLLPDDELKRIRFTPIQDLLKIPRGNIVELSLDEVLLLYPNISKQELECPRCGRNSKTMFWYQYSLVPDLSGNTSVFMRCQYCGHDDYL